VSDRLSPQSDRRRHDVAPSDDHPAADLRLVSVEYADGPDRYTIHPPDPDPAAVTTTWLTADREDFVDLSARR
jgi:hypothetical protein